MFNEADYIAILPCIFGYQVTATIVICSIKETTITVTIIIVYNCLKHNDLHPQPGLQTPFNLTAETNITAIKYYSVIWVVKY